LKKLLLLPSSPTKVEESPAGTATTAVPDDLVVDVDDVEN